MTNAEILDELTTLIRRHSEDPNAPVPLTAHLQDELGMDSLTQVDLIVDIEARFGLTVPDADLPRLRRVSDIVDYVQAAGPR